MTKNAKTFDDLSDKEYDIFCQMTDKALGDFFDGVGWKTAHRNVIRWCARRGLSEEAMWAWLND